MTTLTVENTSHLHTPRPLTGTVLKSPPTSHIYVTSPLFPIGALKGTGTYYRGVDYIAVERVANGTLDSSCLTEKERDLAFTAMWENGIPEGVMAERLGAPTRWVTRRKRAEIYGPPRTYWRNCGPKDWRKVTRTIKYGPTRGTSAPHFPHVTTKPSGPLNVEIRHADGTHDVVPVRGLRLRQPQPRTKKKTPS